MDSPAQTKENANPSLHNSNVMRTAQTKTNVDFSTYEQLQKKVLKDGVEFIMLLQFSLMR
jgi:hypothetical protein